MFIPSDTKLALDGAPHENRSLYFDRFANPYLREKNRSDWFEAGCKVPIQTGAKNRLRDSFFPAGSQFIYGQLKARLMINMAGGVMENAGLCLDRFGIPYIPGSTIKGCARRAALHSLREWTQSGKKPEASDACHPAVQSFDSPEAMLHRIAIVFGWGENEWTDPKSDFLWALSADSNILKTVHSSKDIHGISTHAGTVAFFPAHPNTDPGLDMDILTCHHPDYYGKPTSDFAPDTEEPNPVTFPAVRAQSGDDHFTFALCALRKQNVTTLQVAKVWLTLGLEVFGLGAKTAAGYGWFEVAAVTRKIEKRREDLLLERQRKEQDARVKAEQDAERQRAAEYQKQLEGLSESEKHDFLLGGLTDQQFEQKVADFCKKTRPEQEAIVRAMRSQRSKAWDDLKQKVERKPKQYTQIADTIRAVSKSINLGKMP
jgi:CRISPR-associated protein Cmr6